MGIRVGLKHPKADFGLPRLAEVSRQGRDLAREVGDFGLNLVELRLRALSYVADRSIDALLDLVHAVARAHQARVLFAERTGELFEIVASGSLNFQQQSQSARLRIGAERADRAHLVGAGSELAQPAANLCLPGLRHREGG